MVRLGTMQKLAVRLVLCSALFAACQTGALAKKPKRPKLPTQDAFSQGCVTVSTIYYHGWAAFVPEPGIDAKVHNSCNAAAQVFLTLAYFDAKGVQFGNGTEFMTMAPGADWQLHHQAQVYGSDRARLKLVKFISAIVDSQ